MLGCMSQTAKGGKAPKVTFSASATLSGLGVAYLTLCQAVHWGHRF